MNAFSLFTVKRLFQLSLLSSLAFTAVLEAKKQATKVEPCIECSEVDSSNAKIKEGFICVPERVASDGSVIPAARIFVKLQGKSRKGLPTLVFVHGLGFSHVEWSCQQAELSSSFQTLTLDLRGFGCSQQSDPATVKYNYELFADDIHFILQKLCIKNPIMIGHSLGGGITLFYTNRYPGELSKIMTVGTDPLFVVPDSFVLPGCDPACPGFVVPTSPTCWPYPFATESGVAGLFQLFNDLGYETVVRNVFTTLFYNESCTDQLVDAQNSLIETFLQEGQAITENVIINLLNADLRPILPAINIPALITAGTIDLVIPPQASAFLASQIPGAVAVNFANKGHNPQVTDFKRFNCLLKDFATGALNECCVCPLVKPLGPCGENKKVRK